MILGAQASQPTKVPKGPDTSKSVATKNGQQSKSTSDQQQPANPPTIIVTPQQKSAKELEDERRDREREITIQAENRTFTGWLVIVAVLTGLAVGWQAWETRKAANAARDSIILAHRPKIIVREIEIPEAETLSTVGRGHSRGTEEFRQILASYKPEITQLSGSFRITNKGTTTATISLMNAIIYLGHELPNVNPCFKNELQQTALLTPGTTGRINFDPRPVTSEEVAAILNGQLLIYAIGKIVYTDALKGSRRTGFARAFDIQTGRFKMRRDEPDYEYVD